MHPVAERVVCAVQRARPRVYVRKRDACTVVFRMPQRLDVYLQIGTEPDAEDDDDDDEIDGGGLFARVSYPLAMGIDSRDYRFEIVRPSADTVRALKVWEDQVLNSVLAGIDGSMSIAPPLARACSQPPS